MLDPAGAQRLAAELDHADPLTIMDRCLSEHGAAAAIAFSGAEDIVLLEFARQTGRPFQVFALDTGRLHPETYELFAQAEDFFKLRITMLFPQTAAVEALVQAKGSFSFRVDGHQECCQIRKVEPLARHLATVSGWVTGQRKDQSKTRTQVPVVQIDPAFRGRDGGPLVKWNPLANQSSANVWGVIRAFELPYNVLHQRGYVSIGCAPCTRPVLPGQHEREGRWWWEDSASKECGLHKGNLNRS